MKKLFVGINGEKAIGSKETLKQIEEVKSFECALEYNGQKLTWKDFDNPQEPKTLFRAIVRDREKRIDKKMLMADRPPFCVITVDKGKAVRLEYYEGHNKLSLIYDVRAPELKNKKLAPYYEE
ncbi:MAG: hypothetical protein H0Z24_03190 [Thermosipho sp. (in: Bacteria)]|nr:hypothetical protein [Thermosipho sp. (in: thermotogales)]